ncbi:hypothetical protein [Aestuariivivens sediminis]|uniref:hypothetical protein n=1 Tax=Aestuariivivens sediminis TaxID=2913557 RepID=UPI001F5A2A16|nr:hypothetical protein [Aestuariivivens sediminis]
MKHLQIFIILLVTSLSIHSQDLKNESENVKTKMDAFASKTGVITKFIDFNLEDLKSSYGIKIDTRIRKVNSGSLESYFYQIIKPGKYSNSTASIEYSDLLELIKAIEVLENNESEDVISNPDYLENKFITEDGFQLGYYVNNGKSKWYLKLEKYGSDNTVL